MHRCLTSSSRFARKKLRIVVVPMPSSQSGKTTFIHSRWETSYKASLNVILWPGGAILSSFQEMRRPKPATPITSNVI